MAVIALGRTDGAPAPAPRTAERAAPPGLRELYAKVDGMVARVDALRGPDDPPFGNGRHDAIVRIGARATTTEGSVASAVAARPPGERVELRILRDGRERTLTARLARQPSR